MSTENYSKTTTAKRKLRMVQHIVPSIPTEKPKLMKPLLTDDISKCQILHLSKFSGGDICRFDIFNMLQVILKISVSTPIHHYLPSKYLLSADRLLGAVICPLSISSLSVVCSNE